MTPIQRAAALHEATTDMAAELEEMRAARDRAALAAFEAGYSAPQIARALGIGGSMVERYLRRARITRAEATISDR